MLLTLLLSLVLIAALCILIYAAVGLIQNRKLFTTAPKDIQAAAGAFPSGSISYGFSSCSICGRPSISSVWTGSC